MAYAQIETQQRCVLGYFGAQTFFFRTTRLRESIKRVETRAFSRSGLGLADVIPYESGSSIARLLPLSAHPLSSVNAASCFYPTITSQSFLDKEILTLSHTIFSNSSGPELSPEIFFFPLKCISFSEACTIPRETNQKRDYIWNRLTSR